MIDFDWSFLDSGNSKYAVESNERRKKFDFAENDFFEKIVIPVLKDAGNKNLLESDFKVEERSNDDVIKFCLYSDDIFLFDDKYELIFRFENDSNEIVMLYREGSDTAVSIDLDRLHYYPPNQQSLNSFLNTFKSLFEMLWKRELD